MWITKFGNTIQNTVYLYKQKQNTMTISEINKLQQMKKAMELVRSAIDNTEETNNPEIEKSIDTIYRESLKITSITTRIKNETK